MSQHDLDFAFLESFHTLGELRMLALEDRSTAAGPIHIAISREGYRRVMIQLEETSSDVRYDRESAGVQAFPEHHSVNGNDQAFLVLECKMSHLAELFTLIAGEFVDCMNGSARDPGAEAHEVLERWRQLLAQPPREAPSESVLQGLWGELWHLAQLTAQDPGAFDVWTGWDATAHDFRASGTDIEVKTIRKTSGWRVQINGVDQLDLSGERLVLSVIEVERAGTGGVNVPDLIEEILGHGVNRARLAFAMEHAGFAWRHRKSEDVQGFRLELTEHRAWFVDEEFPRVVGESFIDLQVPVDVSNIKYTITLGGRASSAIAQDEFKRVLEEMISPGAPS